MIKLNDDMKKQVTEENTILLGYRGSVAHGMHVPSTDPDSIDDIDLMGVYLNPPDYYIGMKKYEDVTEHFIDQWDAVNYELKKFVGMLTKSNPNTMSMLFIKPEHYIGVHPYGKLIIDNRQLFVSKLAYGAYIGYAYDQLKKMGSCKCLGYMGKKRKELVERFGYDTKNASHCIRLLKTCIELLNSGSINVFRESDADYLLSIKRGDLTIDEVKCAADDLFASAEIAYSKSSIPDEPDYDKINRIVSDIILDYVNRGTL